MARRQVLTIAGAADPQAPVPAAVAAGNMVYGMRVTGQEPGSGRLPSDPQAQIEQLFQNLEAYLRQAGGDLGDLAFAGVYMADMVYREQLNHTWLRLFPSESDRPARNTVQQPLTGGQIASAEFTAVLGGSSATARRQVLKLPGVAEVHNPAPTAVRVRNYVHCVRVTGQEPGSGRFPEDPRAQIEQLFANIDALFEQAGGSIDDLAFIKISLRSSDGEGLQNVAHREILNEVWLRYFPDRDDRPARHTVPAAMPDNRLISASFSGVLGPI